MTYLPLLAIPSMAVLNQLRGGGALFQLGRATERLPGRPGWWCVPFVCLCALLAWSWPWALYFGLCWLIWMTFPHGRWMRPHLGLIPHADGKVSGYEMAIERLARGNAFAAFTISNLLTMLPFAVLSPWLLLIAPAMSFVYVIVQRDFDGDIKHCELVSGGVWGLAIACIGMLA